MPENSNDVGAACSLCDGFAWVPESNNGENWYQKDWRLLLDSSVQWRRCPACGDNQPSMKQLHIDLSKILLKRIAQELTEPARCGLWQTGVLENGMCICTWKDIACVLCDQEKDHWKIFSVMGVTDELNREQCQFFLRQAGAPELPSL